MFWSKTRETGLLSNSQENRDDRMQLEMSNNLEIKASIRLIGCLFLQITLLLFLYQQKVVL